MNEKRKAILRAFQRALATAPTMSEADVQQGDTWHYRVTKGAALSTGYIAEKSGKTVLMKQNQFAGYGSRHVTIEIEWVERIDRAAAKEQP
jgi:hypothetical protein